jgi:hypothetical protein
MDPQRSRPIDLALILATSGPENRTCSLDHLFNGNKAKWLPLYHRLLARLSRLSEIEMVPSRAALKMGYRCDEGVRYFGQVAVAAKGLEIGLSFKKAPIRSLRLRPSLAKSPRFITHRVTISEASQIDDELFGFIRAAQISASPARRRKGAA